MTQSLHLGAVFTGIIVKFSFSLVLFGLVHKTLWYHYNIVPKGIDILALNHTLKEVTEQSKCLGSWSFFEI